MVTENISKMQENYNARVHVYLPAQTIEVMKKEFDLADDNVENFLSSVIQRIVQEHTIQRESSNVFAKEEVKELEDDLKGLGYI